MKINDIINKSHEMVTPALGDLLNINKTKYQFVNAYLTNYEQIDGILSYKYGEGWESLAQIMELWYANCESWIYAHLYKYDTIWKTLDLEYNPIANVDGTEKETIINGGGFTLNKSMGERADLNADTFGQQHTHTVSTDKSYPFDVGAQNVTNAAGQDMDTKADGVSNSSRFTKGAQSDRDEQKHNDKTIIERERKGNIGVTSTQELIRQERNVADIVFWEELFKDLVGDLCTSTQIYTSTDWGW